MGACGSCILSCLIVEVESRNIHWAEAEKVVSPKRRENSRRQGLYCGVRDTSAGDCRKSSKGIS